MKTKIKKYKFDAVIIKGTRGGAGIIFPLNCKKEFGTGRQIKVQAQFDKVPYRGSLAPMGDGNHVLLVKKEIRKKINKGIGDKITVELVEDVEPRNVSVFNDFEVELRKVESVWQNFEKFAYTHKKEYVHWVDEAKKIETRKRRIEKSVKMIKENKKFS